MHTNDPAPEATQSSFDRVLCLGFLVTDSGDLTPTLQYRVDRAIEHYLAGRTRSLVMSGGRLDHEPCSAASAMNRYAVAKGVRESDVVELDQGLDTVGEAIFSRLLLTPASLASPLLVVTSAYHVQRAQAIFRFVYGAAPHLGFEAVQNDPEQEMGTATKEAASLQRFCDLFSGIEEGDIEAILDRFWQDHALYRDARFDALRRRTFSALKVTMRA